MKVPVEWLELRDNKIVAVIKQKKGGSMPMTVDTEKLRAQFSFLRHIKTPEQMLGLLKSRKESQEIHGHKIITRPLTIDLPNLKMGKNKRETRLQNKRDEMRWSKC